MATNPRPPYTTSSFWVLLIGVVLIIVSSFGIDMPIVDMFKLGVGVAFLSWLIRF